MTGPRSNYYNNGNETWNKVDYNKMELDKYKRLCSQLEKDNKELNRKLYNVGYDKDENKRLKKKVKELELRIEKLNKFNRFEIMEI